MTITAKPRRARAVRSASRGESRAPAKAPKAPPAMRAPKDRPIDQPRPGIAGAGRRAEQGDGDERGRRRVAQRHPGRRHQARDDQETAADAEKARGQPGRETGWREPQRPRDIDPRLGVALGARPPEHRGSNDRHGESEPDQQLLAVDLLREMGSGQRARRGPRRRTPAHRAILHGRRGPGPRDTMAALTATAAAEVPIATCGSRTPTT